MGDCGLSEESIVLESLHLVVVRAERFVDVVRICDVASSLLLIAALLSFGEHFFSCDLVSLDHLDGENVIDFNVMGRDTVVQEVGWEHHIVPLVPELWVVLRVELKGVSHSNKSETRYYQEG